MRRSRPLGIAIGFLLLAFPAAAGELSIAVDGLRSPDGDILIGLYDSADSFNRAIEQAGKEGFLNDPARVAGAALRASPARKAGVVFRNLEPGRYAVILFHDENGNGRLDKNFWGVPTEPYGFSNDAQGVLGPPTFEDAAMTMDGRDKAVTITLVRHRDYRGKEAPELGSLGELPASERP